jgi:hypothetical protein
VGRISLEVLDSWRADHYKGRVAPLRHCPALSKRSFLEPSHPKITTPWVSFAKMRSSLPQSPTNLEHLHRLRNMGMTSWRKLQHRRELWTRLKSRG